MSENWTSTEAGMAFDELCRRIRRATEHGQPLHGMKFYEPIESRNEGHDSLPRVYITEYSDREVPASGAPADNKPGINMVIRQSATVVLQLVTDRRNGWHTPVSVTRVSRMGLLTVRNILLDEIEKNEDGDIDCSLSGTVEKPVTFSMRLSGVFDLGLVAEIEVTLDGMRFDRSYRSRLITTEQVP